MSYPHFSAYASFLLRNHLVDFAKKNIYKAREAKLPLLKKFENCSEAELLNLSVKSSEEFLTSIAKEYGIEAAKENLIKWSKNQSKHLKKEDIEATDLVMLHELRKQLLIEYLDVYVQDINEHKLLVQELNQFYAEILRFSFELYNKVQNEIYKQHIDFTKTILDSAVVSIVGLQAIRNEDHTITDFEYVVVNDKAERLMNRKKETLLGKRLLEEYPHVVQEGIFEKYLETVELGKDIELKFLYTFEGFNNWFRQTFAKWGDGLVVFTEDIGKDIEREEKLLEKNKELEETRKDLEKAYLLLESKVKERTKELTMINDLNKMIAGQLDLKKIIQSVTDITTRMTKAQFGAFFYNLINEKGEAYTLYTVSGVPIEHFSKFPMPRNTKVFEPTFRGTGIIRSDDITKDPRYGQNPPYHGMPEGHLPVRSYLAVPVISRTGEVLGGLFYGHEQTGVFTEEAENLVSAITTHAAISIDNAKLFSSLQKNQEALAYQSILNKTITDNATSCLLMMNDKGYCTFMNPAGEKMFGYTFEEISSKPLHYMIHHHRPDGSFYPMDECPIDRALPENSNVRAHEDLFFKKDGSSFPVLCAASPIFENGKPIATVIEVRDITNDKRSQKEILESNLELQTKNSELEKMNKDLDNFIYTASHDLKAPVSNIEGLVYSVESLLEEDYLDKEELSQMISLMEKSITRFKSTILDLTEISKVQKDTQEKEKIHFAEVLDDVIFSIVDLIKASQAEIHKDFEECKTIRFSRSHLQSIFYNLISNAIKYRHPERTPKIHIKTFTRESYAVLQISDNGLGIAPQHKEKLFSMFKRFHDHVEGSGVGLYIVKRIIDNAGGKIEATSEINVGTTFNVYLKNKT